MRRVIQRSAAEKADADLSWARPDEEFFAAGACHVLAAVFLATYPDAGFSAWSICPRAPHQRGRHVVVARGDVVFDWAGYERREIVLADQIEAMRTTFPDWNCDFLPLAEDPIGWEFCRARNHRHPTEFRHDPIPRAQAFIRSFPRPDRISDRAALTREPSSAE